MTGPSFSVLYNLYYAAGDPFTAVSGGLRVEVIRHIVNDDCFSDYVGGLKSVRIDGEKRNSV